MAKIPATTDEIRREIEKRIDASQKFTAACEGYGAPIPIPLKDSGPGECNWTVSGSPPSDVFIFKIIEDVMAEYDLIE